MPRNSLSWQVSSEVEMVLFFTTEATEAQRETAVLYPFYVRKENFFGHKAISRAASGGQMALGSLTAHLIRGHRLAHKRFQRATPCSQFWFLDAVDECGLRLNMLQRIQQAVDLFGGAGADANMVVEARFAVMADDDAGPRQRVAEIGGWSALNAVEDKVGFTGIG